MTWWRLAWLGAWGVVVVGLSSAPTGVASTRSGLRPGEAASVDGRPLSIPRLDHWLGVAAKSQALISPGAVVIVASDPPRFRRCIAQARERIPALMKFPTRTLRRDCKALFRALVSQAMDFLIKSDWYLAEAAREGVKVSSAKVKRAFERSKAQQFASDRAFRSFLRETGETVKDLLFRFRVNLTYTSLLRAEHARPTSLEAAVARVYRPRTWCAKYYVIADCANASKSPHPPTTGSFTGNFFPTGS